jgi:diguanylate cyclase (GGDEF)-like protein
MQLNPNILNTLTSLSFMAQALAALVFAFMLGGFYRTYRRDYLQAWTWSWAAFCFYLLGGAASFLLTPPYAPDHPYRVFSSTLSLIGGYWQIAWLAFGTWELLTERVVDTRLRRWILTVSTVAAVVVVWFTAPLHNYSLVTLWRMGPRSLAAGLACLAAAWGVSLISPRPVGFGRRIVGVAFLLFGIQQMVICGVVAQLWEVNRLLTVLTYLGPFDLLFYGLIGFSMVIWLLDDERQRSLKASAQLEHLAYHDPLTGLPNRNGLVKRVRPALDEAKRRGYGLAVILLDLDHFKVINDSLGHSQGNDLLKELGRRMRGILPDAESLAHLGGDEFAILLPEVPDEATLKQTAEGLLSVIRLPLDAQGRELYITASLGIARYPEDANDPEELLKCADIAMYQAKALGRDHLQIYAPSMDVGNLEQLSLAHDLRTALAESRELLLVFQPILDTHTRRIDAFEALLRWQHPRRGLLTPADFLWLAESTGLSETLDLWVLREACRRAQEWRREGLLHLRVSVNISARPFQRPDLVDRVRDVLSDTGLPASSLELEITETLAMQNAEASLEVLQGLKDLGVRISIDDFGTGYSSLSYLTNFPIDTLKVDAAFIRSLGSGRGSEEVIAAVIALAHSLDIDVVAEGVEHEEQWQILREQGCDKVQGFLFSRPVAASECRRLLAEERTAMAMPAR